MFRFAGVSASARPFVINGIALVIPPDPVPVPTPAPVRLNHVSSVNCAAPSPGAAPNVTYWLVPLSWRAVGVGAAAAPPPTARTPRAVPIASQCQMCRRGAAVPLSIANPSPQGAGHGLGQAGVTLRRCVSDYKHPEKCEPRAATTAERTA